MGGTGRDGWVGKFPFVLSRFTFPVSRDILSHFILIPSGDAGTEELAHSTSAPSSPTPKDSRFWESLSYHAL